MKIEAHLIYELHLDCTNFNTF